jgi:hypothetical protein
MTWHLVMWHSCMLRKFTVNYTQGSYIVIGDYLVFNTMLV